MLPQGFLKRMQDILGEDYPSFLSAMSEGKAVHAYRVNTVKIPLDRFLAQAHLPAAPVPYAPDGFYHEEAHIGNHPAHHAGMIYAQDPGAMSTVNALTVPRGARVLDLCAAPGGKSAQLAAAIGPEGVLVANEYVPSRCKILVGNIERLGIPNALVLNRDAAALRAMFPAYFDIVLIDAPCSGEGMFRKSEEARAEWSEENVRRCAARQATLLEEGVAMLRPGGMLLYSTCTFAPEENEQQVAALLAHHPELTLCPVSDAVSEHTAPGICQEGDVADLSLTRRFYPHISPGEGQYLALMRKADGGEGKDAPAYADAAKRPCRAESALLRDFFARAWGAPEVAEEARVLGGKLLLPPSIPLPSAGVFAAGVALGEIRRDVFFPHHQLFTTHGGRFLNQINLLPQDARLPLYLHGDVIEAEGVPNGYAAVLFCGIPLGGAKVVDGVAKNLYPKGLRRHP